VAGGLYVNASNEFNQRRRTRVSMVLEGGLEITGPITDGLYLHLGYSGMHWATVLRPGDQIDVVAPRTLIPATRDFGPTGRETRPLAPMRTGEFWAHGLTLGLEVRY
jgi:hypothetical protein